MLNGRTTCWSCHPNGGLAVQVLCRACTRKRLCSHKQFGACTPCLLIIRARLVFKPQPQEKFYNRALSTKQMNVALRNQLVAQGLIKPRADESHQIEERREAALTYLYHREALFARTRELPWLPDCMTDLAEALNLTPDFGRKHE